MRGSASRCARKSLVALSWRSTHALTFGSATSRSQRCGSGAPRSAAANAMSGAVVRLGWTVEALARDLRRHAVAFLERRREVLRVAVADGVRDLAHRVLAGVQQLQRLLEPQVLR